MMMGTKDPRFYWEHKDYVKLETFWKMALKTVISVCVLLTFVCYRLLMFITALFISD